MTPSHDIHESAKPNTWCLPMRWGVHEHQELSGPVALPSQLISRRLANKLSDSISDFSSVTGYSKNSVLAICCLDSKTSSRSTQYCACNWRTVSSTSCSLSHGGWWLGAFRQGPAQSEFRGP